MANINWKPHAKHDHIYVVFRFDDYVSGLDAVSMTKAYFTMEDAEAEVRRLNELNHDKQCCYAWRVARLVSKSEDEGAS